jgi:hypothetical protein
MESQRELDDTERRTEMTAGLGHGADDGFTQLPGEMFELRLVEAAEVGRALQALEVGHDRLAPARDLLPWVGRTAAVACDCSMRV